MSASFLISLIVIVALAAFLIHSRKQLKDLSAKIRNLENEHSEYERHVSGHGKNSKKTTIVTRKGVTI